MESRKLKKSKIPKIAETRIKKSTVTAKKANRTEFSETAVAKAKTKTAEPEKIVNDHYQKPPLR
jgi:hypothetical protein